MSEPMDGWPRVKYFDSVEEQREFAELAVRTAPTGVAYRHFQGDTEIFFNIAYRQVAPHKPLKDLFRHRKQHWR